MNNKRIILLVAVFSLSFVKAGNVNNTKPQNEVVNVGDDVILECRCNEKTPIHWKKEEKLITDITTLSYDIIFNEKDNCSHGLKIIHVNMTSAGRYTCAKMLMKKSEHYVGFVIVYENDLKCVTKYSHSNQTVLQQAYVQWTDEIIINCSFTFHANQTCRAIPLWIDNIRNQTLSDSNSNIQFGAENKFIWLSFPGSAAFENETSFTLSIAFNCSVQRTNMSEEHYANNIPIIITEFMSPLFVFPRKQDKEEPSATTISNSGSQVANSAGISNSDQNQTNVVMWAAILPTYITIMILALFIYMMYKRKEARSSNANIGIQEKTLASHSNVDEYQQIDEGYISPSTYTALQSKDYASIQSNEKRSSAYEEIEEENDIKVDLMDRPADGSFSDYEETSDIHNI